VSRGSGLEALMEALEGISDEDISALAEALKTVDFKKLAELIKLLSENMDAFKQAIELVSQLKETGALASLLALTEISDETFNAITRPDFMTSIANGMMLLYMLSQFNHGLLMNMAETMPRCSEAALNELKKTEKGMGIRELLSLMRSPEMAAMMKAMITAVRCIKKS